VIVAEEGRAQIGERRATSLMGRYGRLALLDRHDERGCNKASRKVAFRTITSPNGSVTAEFVMQQETGSMEFAMADTFRIYRANSDPALAEALTDVLMDCVEGGASVGFMHPLTRPRALAFWQNVLDSAARGERIVLVAEDVESHTIIGTVQVVLAMPENQPHRGEVAKMQVHRRARRRGIGEALMRAAEDAARQAGKTLLVLDTLTGSDAERLYSRLGWERCGVIPGYALLPQGGLCSTTVFYRVLADGSSQTPGPLHFRSVSR
jgi:GNAT superfamily N-acetyltransferase